MKMSLESKLQKLVFGMRIEYERIKRDIWSEENRRLMFFEYSLKDGGRYILNSEGKMAGAVFLVAFSIATWLHHTNNPGLPGAKIPIKNSQVVQTNRYNKSNDNSFKQTPEISIPSNITAVPSDSKIGKGLDWRGFNEISKRYNNKRAFALISNFPIEYRNGKAYFPPVSNIDWDKLKDEGYNRDSLVAIIRNKKNGLYASAKLDLENRTEIPLALEYHDKIRDDNLELIIAIDDSKNHIPIASTKKKVVVYSNDPEDSVVANKTPSLSYNNKEEKSKTEANSGYGERTSYSNLNLSRYHKEIKELGILLKKYSREIPELKI